ncbi:MAG: LamB/YcsF family protein, partial [Pseudomonadota bacterium]
MNIDLNADMGESFGMYKLGNDAEFMKYITSANVACGFHAGDPSVMKATVALAKEFGVAVGAHPGLPDLQGFGRREMKLT